MDNEICVNRKEVLKYLGFKGIKPDEKTQKEIDEAATQILREAQPMVCSVRVKIEGHNPLRFENADIVLEGNDIKKHLEDCDECVFAAATIGNGADELIKRLSVTDMAKAVIYDACASSAIESLCDSYTKSLEMQARREGLYITDRYSPGYGDLPIESQRAFCDILNTQKKIGLCCSRTMMLTPTKSVTAIIGISKTEQSKRRLGCESCKLFYDCEFLKKGVSCYENI